MTGSLPPAALLILGGLAVPLLPARLRPAWGVLLPLASLAHQLLALPVGTVMQLELFDYTLTLARVDRLSFLFGLIFHVVAALTAIFAIHVRDRVQQIAGPVYAGAAIAAVFAGDLITLFAYWELTALASVFLIWASRTERAYRAGMRYLIIQVGSGVLLLSGAVYRTVETGSIAFEGMRLDSLGSTLIFLAFGVKCAFPLLHNWLQDAYPEATPTGTVFLSAFTTKLAIYALIRGFRGTDELIWIGVVMTLFPIFFAVIENDLRRTLAYSLNNQLGFMVVGVGVGTELAVNGAAAHAFAHLLYKALLFMSMGAVLHRTGTAKASELGGLYRSMPFTAGCCVVGAASIAGFPPLSGFVTKALTLDAVAAEHLMLASLGLLVASAGVMEHSGIKIPFFAFFAHDSGIRCREAPWNMLVAMGLAASACIAIGVAPGLLYSLLPFPVDYQPHTVAHWVTQLQLLCFAGLAFFVLYVRGIYPREVPSLNLDFDWSYRRLAPTVVLALGRGVVRLQDGMLLRASRSIGRVVGTLERHHGPQGMFARTWTTGSTVLWVAVILGVFLLAYYL